MKCVARKAPTEARPPHAAAAVAAPAAPTSAGEDGAPSPPEAPSAASPVEAAPEPETQAASPAAPRTYVTVDPALRKRAIELVVKDKWSVADAGRAIGIKPASLNKFIERFKKEKTLDLATRTRGRPPLLSDEQLAKLRGWAEADRALSYHKLSEKARAEFGFPVSVPTVRRMLQGIQAAYLTNEQEAYVRRWLDDDSSLSIKALVNKVHSELGASVSVAAVRRAMRGLHFSLKRTSPLPPSPQYWNNGEAIELRHEYGMEYMRLLAKRHKFVFVDEVAFSYTLNARFSPSPLSSSQGELETGLATQFNVRTQPISVAAAVMSTGLAMYKLRRGEFVEPSFESLLTEVADALREAGIEDAVIIMTSGYKAQALEHPRLISTLGHSLLFLPPNSPFLNPAGTFFSEWKEIMRSGSLPSTERDLLALLETRGASASSTDCARYFRRMEGYIYPSVMKENVLG